MAEVKIYTTTYCPYCTGARELLQKLEIEFEEFNLQDKPEELRDLKQRTGMRTVPQVFIKGELIGGYTELAGLHQSGKLAEMLK